MIPHRKGVRTMTNQQMEHVEKLLIAAMDAIVCDIEERKVIRGEIEVLPEIAFALDKLRQP